MGMDRRLRPGSKPLRNQCGGTGVQPQVYKSNQTFRGKGERRREVDRKRRKLGSFIYIITIKNIVEGATGF